mmetsp:Transcript_15616/g.18532  ORF Transcript_15616/g.18532 Transcript_15616/m.18532 type:complete len:127 (+) Transcript_15616:260-640(+)
MMPSKRHKGIIVRQASVQACLRRIRQIGVMYTICLVGSMVVDRVGIVQVRLAHDAQRQSEAQNISPGGVLQKQERHESIKQDPARRWKRPDTRGYLVIRKTGIPILHPQGTSIIEALMLNNNVPRV